MFLFARNKIKDLTIIFYFKSGAWVELWKVKVHWQFFFKEIETLRKKKVLKKVINKVGLYN